VEREEEGRGRHRAGGIAGDEGGAGDRPGRIAGAGAQEVLGGLSCDTFKFKWL
jgi:hypothetical protein